MNLWELAAPAGLSGLRVDAHAWTPSSAMSTDAPEWHPQPLPSSKGRCHFFLKGVCRKGTACPFAHEVSNLQGAAITPKEKELDMSLDVRDILLDGACCSFGPGFTVNAVVTDSESRIHIITISGLHIRVTDSDILGKLLPFGAVRVTRKHETYAFAKFDRPEDASAAMAGLNGSFLDQWAATSAKSAYPKKSCVSVVLALPPGAIVTHNNSVKVQWYAPSCCAWAHYKSGPRHDKSGPARSAATQSNGKKLWERTISTKFQPPKPLQTSSFSVYISGLPGGISDRDVSHFMTKHGKAGPPSSITMGDPCFIDKKGGQIVESLLQKIGPLASFQEAPHRKGEIKHKALAKFARPCDALEVCTRLHQSKVAELGGAKLFVQRVFSAKFVLPNAVYAVVGGQVMHLLSVLENGDEHVRHKIFPAESVTSISIQADSPNALAFAKGILNPLLVGDSLKKSDGQVLWHVEFSKKKTEVQLEQLNKTGQTCVQRDLRRREIRIWGEPVARERAMAEILILLEAIQNQPCAVPVKPAAFRAIFQQGQGVFVEIESTCGARAVSLDWKTRSLLFAGDDSVARKVTKFLATKLESADKKDKANESLSFCPICYCEPDDDSLKLSCQHDYCTACFREWIVASSAPGGASFPLICLNEDCKQAVAIDDLDQVLSRDQKVILMRAALDEYVSINLGKLQYCISPGVFAHGLVSMSISVSVSVSVSISVSVSVEVEVAMPVDMSLDVSVYVSMSLPVRVFVSHCIVRKLLLIPVYLSFSLALSVSLFSLFSLPCPSRISLLPCLSLISLAVAISHTRCLSLTLSPSRTLASSCSRALSLFRYICLSYSIVLSFSRSLALLPSLACPFSLSVSRSPSLSLSLSLSRVRA